MKRNLTKTNSEYLLKRLPSGMNQKYNNDLHFTPRPYSAKTDFKTIVSRNPNGRRNFSNRMMSSQHMIHQTPSMKTLPNRPQTAVAQGNLRASIDSGQMRTIESPYTGGQKTVTNLTSYSRSRKGKKPRPKIKDLIFEGIVTEEGVAIFQNIPKTVCHIDTSENDFFKGASKYVTLPTEAEKEDIIELYLPVERQDAYTTTVYMLKGEESEKEYSDANEEEHKELTKNTYFENLTVRAVLLDIYNQNKSESNSEDSDLDSEVEYEEEFEQYEDKDGK